MSGERRGASYLVFVSPRPGTKPLGSATLTGNSLTNPDTHSSPYASTDKSESKTRPRAVCHKLLEVSFTHSPTFKYKKETLNGDAVSNISLGFYKGRERRAKMATALTTERC